KSGPLQSSFISPSLPKTRSPGFGFPFLSYSISKYSFHLFCTSSGSVSNLPVSSLIVLLLLLTFFLAESFLTFAYTKSDRPLASSSSSSLHSLSHHFSLAFWVSLLSSLFYCLYFFFLCTVFLLFLFFISCILYHRFLKPLPSLLYGCTRLTFHAFFNTFAQCSFIRLELIHSPLLLTSALLHFL